VLKNRYDVLLVHVRVVHLNHRQFNQMTANNGRLRNISTLTTIKGELKKHLEHQKLGERIVGIETVNKMTDPQIAAKVRQHFLNLK
jgi:hypothetical protein